jgi:hypothetical protein
VTLEKLELDIQEVKIVLHKMVHLLEEDLELNEATQEELRAARSEPLSHYIDHEIVLKDFA